RRLPDPLPARARHDDHPIGGFVFGVIVALAGRRRYLAPFKRRGTYGRECSPSSAPRLLDTNFRRPL
ncbi:MAG: hypothetical protein ACOC6J_08150, partial [Spirochaetota bacterium]